jgi:hypothetical protein
VRGRAVAATKAEADRFARNVAPIERCLKKYIYPSWQHRPFRGLKRADVADLLDRIEDNHGKRQADLCLAIIRKMMNWYATRNDDYLSLIVRGMQRSNAAARLGGFQCVPRPLRNKRALLLGKRGAQMQHEAVRIDSEFGER